MTRRLHLLLVAISRNKAITLATSAMALAVTYATHFIATAPAEYGQNELAVASLDRSLTEGKVIGRIHDDLIETMTAYISTGRTFDQLIITKSPDSSPSPRELSAAIKQLHESSNRMNVAIGELQGVRLSDPALEVFRPQLVQFRIHAANVRASRSLVRFASRTRCFRRTASHNQSPGKC